MFCFDNTFSAVSEKIIFFELILDNMEDNEEPDEWKEYVHGTDSLGMKLEDIMVRMQPPFLDAVLLLRVPLYLVASNGKKAYSDFLFCVFST